jgi:uncharacterized protein involved in response to NO
MTTTTAEQMRNWQGPALLSYGFRPFFLGGAVWAALAMVLWVPMLNGDLTLPSAFDPVSWHAHELLFGYLGAVAAGFLLTAVPNWTGRLPIVGWRLGLLALLWLAGRLAIAVSAHLPPGPVAAADLAFPLLLALVTGREIVAGRNWRNLMVLAMLAVLTLGNALFHWEAAQGDFAARGAGLRLGLGAAILMIALIGGRIVPSFTRNWLVKRGGGALPVPPMQGFDRLSLAALAVAVLVWVLAPASVVTGISLLVAGGLHLARLARWCGHRTLAEPLVLALHLGYLFLPLGALAIGTGALWPGLIDQAAAQHLWMAGAIGLMTLAVMTRASLGHTGQALTAGPGSVTIYAAVTIATLARFAAGTWTQAADWLIPLAGIAWILAFAGFALGYGPALLRGAPGQKARPRQAP